MGRLSTLFNNKMLLRTSSNPLTQTLLSPSLVDGSRRALLFSTAAAVSSSSVNTAAALCRQISRSRLGYSRIIKKPINCSMREFRRAFSESNLEDLVSSSDPCCGEVHYHQPVEGLGKESGMVVDGQCGSESERTVTLGDKIEDIGKSSIGSTVEEESETETEEKEEKSEGFKPPLSSLPMYLATGLGADIIANDLVALNYARAENLEEYYRSMVEEFPYHPLLLRNYAQVLKDNGNLHEARDYFLRAMVADPENEEILAQYVDLAWELHADRKRAEEYFERAAQAIRQDSRVLAATAYASFLWEVDDGSRLQDYTQTDSRDDYFLSKGSNLLRFKGDLPCVQMPVPPGLREDAKEA